MKAFVFSDLHANSKQLHNFVHFFDENKDIDLVIFAGDALNMGEPYGFMVNFIEAITKIGLSFFWVPGNNDFGMAYHKLNAKYPSLEGRVAVIPDSIGDLKDSRLRGNDNIKLTGVGGSPASWAGQYAGEKMINRKSIAGSIFVSHTPPPGILVMNKYDFDSPAPGKKLSDSPRVHICGHLHSRWGCGYLGSTKVINPGPLDWGRYAIIDLENLSVEFLRFN